MTPEEDPTHPDYYPRVKLGGVWYAMVPELVPEPDEDGIKTRCTGCALYIPEADHSQIKHCMDSDFHHLENRGVSCDSDDRPHIYIDLNRWDEYLVARVSRRMEAAWKPQN